MNVFVFVLEFKTNMSNNINVTIPADCNISNPGPLEQNPGLEKGLTVLFHESFYVC